MREVEEGENCGLVDAAGALLDELGLVGVWLGSGEGDLVGVVLGGHSLCV